MATFGQSDWKMYAGFCATRLNRTPHQCGIQFVIDSPPLAIVRFANPANCVFFSGLPEGRSARIESCIDEGMKVRCISGR